MLEDQDGDPERRADGNAIQNDRLERDEHRAEGDEQHDRRDAEDHRDNAGESGQQILLQIEARRGKSSHDDLRAAQACAASDRLAHVARQIHHPGQRHRVRGDHVHQGGAPVAAQVRIEELGIALAHRFRVAVEQRQLQCRHAGPERRDAAHLAHPRVLGDRVTQRLESREPATRQRGLAGGQLHHDAQRLDHAARPHLPQRREPLSRFGVRGKPVARGQADLDLREWKGQKGRDEPPAENRAPGMVPERTRPALPALRRVNPGEHAREPSGSVDIAAQDRERRGQKGRRE